MSDHKDKLLEQAAEEIIALKRANDDLNTLALFWRRAAEAAVVGWNALEDKHELLLETLRALVHDNTAPDAVSDTLETVDLGDGVKLRVVEEETPIKR